MQRVLGMVHEDAKLNSWLAARRRAHRGDSVRGHGRLSHFGYGGPSAANAAAFPQPESKPVADTGAHSHSRSYADSCAHTEPHAYARPCSESISTLTARRS